MFSRFTIIILAVTVVLLGGLVIQTAFEDKTVNTGTLKSRALNVDIVKGNLVQQELEARKGEVVVLKITTDQPWLIHLHTIEVAKEIKPGNASFLTFQTNSTGMFEIALHPLHGGMAKNESKDLNVKKVIDNKVNYILVSNNVDDLKEILSKLKDDKTLISYQLNK